MPVMGAVHVVFSHSADGRAVVLTGAVASTLTVSGRQAETLPAASTARVSKVWVPSVVSATGPGCAVPPSTRHSPWSKPESASVPVSASEMPCCQAVGAAGLVFAGRTVSILTSR